jgi:hypothetical protein
MSFLDVKFEVVHVMQWEIASHSTGEDVVEFMVFHRELGWKCLLLSLRD